MPDLTRAERVAHAVALRVAEIPDRDSPADQPEMMLVTRDELIAFIVAEMPPDPQPQPDIAIICRTFGITDEMLSSDSIHTWLSRMFCSRQPQTGALRELRERLPLLRTGGGWRLPAHSIGMVTEEINRLLAAPAPAEPECVTAMRELHRQAAPYRGGGTQACDAWMSKAQDLMRDVVDHSAAGEPAPAEPEPVADAERERRVAEGDGYRALDHAMEILGSCVQPYTGEQAQKVAKVLRQWSDKWAAAVDCIHPDERQTLRDRDAEVARLREELGKAMFSVRRFCGAHVGVPGDACPMCEVERLTKERDEAIRDLKATTAELDDARANADFLRQSVGECHVMISRNSADYQIKTEWSTTDLPPRLRRLMLELDRERGGWEALERLRERMLVTTSSYAGMQYVQACYDWAMEIDKALAARPAQGKEGA